MANFLLRSFAAVKCEIEREDPVRAVRALQYLGMAERAHRVIVARSPMLLHSPPREFVVLSVALVILGAIDQLDQVVDFLVRLCCEEIGLGGLKQIRR